MIYLFSGNNQTALKGEIQKWKDNFLEKFGDFNFFHIQETNQVEKSSLHEILTSGSLFGGKKLVFIELPEAKTEDGEKATNSSLEPFIESLLSSIPEENIVVFYTTNFKERNPLHKKIAEIGKKKDFTITDDIFGVISYIAQSYPNIGKREVESIVKLKSGNLEKSIQEVEKMLTYSENPTIQDIQENITPEPDETIFQFTNTILSGNLKEMHISYKKIEEQMNFYYFYNTLLGSLRAVLFIETLKTKNKSPSQIDNILKLGKRSFLIQKRYPLHTKKIQNLYISIIKFDRKMKTGFTVGNQEEELFKELESEILLSIL